MKTLSNTEIAKKHLEKLQLEDLTSQTKAEKRTFWKKVNTEYLNQFDRLNA
tara:strand:- start:1274 stop:1426 length:153 start_codon:yes stop_codon:yes gene_type:complete